MLTSKIITLTSIQTDQTNRVIDQLKGDNAQLRNQEADLTREVQSMVAASVTPTWTPPATVTTLLLIWDPKVVAAAAERQTPKQQAARSPKPQHLCAPVTLRPAPTPYMTFTPTYLYSPRLSSMVSVSASEVTTLPVQQWETVNQEIRTGKVGRGMSQEGTVEAEFPRPSKAPTETDRRVLLPCKAEAQAESRTEVTDIVLIVNTALGPWKVPTHLRLQKLAYNGKGNLSGLLGPQPQVECSFRP